MPVFALANHHELPPPEKALLRFPSHAAAVKFNVAPSTLPRWRGQIFVALFGDEVPMTAPSGPHVGRTVARIDPTDWSLHTVLESPLARPIDVRFHAFSNALYILDFGNFEMHAERGVVAEANTGKLWRLQLDE